MTLDIIGYMLIPICIVYIIIIILIIYVIYVFFTGNNSLRII